MASTIIIIISGILGFYLALKARNPFTKVSSLLISASTVLLVVPYGPLKQSLPYLIAFSSIIAGFEPGNSIRIKTLHKVFFGVSGIFFAVVAVDRVLTWPVELILWPLVLVYFLVVILRLKKDQRKLQTRLGTLVVWAGLGLDYLLRLF